MNWFSKVLFKFLPVVVFFAGFSSLAEAPKKLKNQKTIKRVQEILYLPRASRQNLLNKKPRFYFHYLEAIFTSQASNDELKWRALMSMTRVYPEKTRPHILKSLKSNNWLFQNAGLTALNIIEPEKALVFAAAFIKSSPSLVLKTAAVELIRKRKARRYKPLLWRELNSKAYFRKGKSLWIRQTIAKTLFELSDPSDKQKFLALTKDEDPGVQTLALRAWEKLSSPPSLDSPERLWGQAP